MDIVQAAGRALRLSKGKKYGYILIPIFIPDGEDFNQAADDQGFKEVSLTVRALATTDRRIFDYLKSISEGKKPKSGSPVDGLTSINQLYKVEADQFNNAINLKVWDRVSFTNFYNFEDAKSFVRNLNLKDLKEWQYYAKSKRPNYIPSAPQNTYQREWKGYGDWLGSGSVSINKIYQNLTYEEAKKIIFKFKIKNYTEHRRIWKKKLKKLNIPAYPDSVFRDKGWISWSDYLGVKIIPGRVNWRTFEDAKLYLRKLKFKSRIEYRDYIRKNKFEKDKIRLPFKAPGIYKDKWVSWKDFIGPSYDAYSLSKYNKGKHLKKSISYVNAKKILRKLKIKNQNQFYRLWKNKNLSKQGIPKKIDYFYKRTKEWHSWEDLLGKQFKKGVKAS